LCRIRRFLFGFWFLVLDEWMMGAFLTTATLSCLNLWPLAHLWLVDSDRVAGTQISMKGQTEAIPPKKEHG
jgi:hypothetical protein